MSGLESLRAYIVGGALVCCGLLAVVLLCWNTLKVYARQMGAAGVVIMLCFLYAMATKPPATFDSLIANNGTHYTNNYSKIVFKWRKVVTTMPNSTPLTISRRAYGTSGGWSDVATTTVGAFTYDLAIASTNFEYYLWCDYVPPTPVHTNGVWLGQIIEKAKGDTGLNKLLIINGELRQNGKVIAP